MMKKPISILLLCGVWPLISSAVDRIHEPGEMAGRGPLTTSGEFLGKHLDTTIPALSPISELLANGETNAAEKVFADYVRRTLKPERAIPEWTRGGKMSEKTAASVKDTMAYKLTSCGTPYQYGDRHVIWTINPTYNGYPEWPWQLSRHPFLTDLAEYYAKTGDEEAAKVWTDMLDSWFDQAPYPGDEVEPWKTLCWRTLDAGIRMPAWSRQIHAFIRSPNVSDGFICRFFRSVYEHGRRLALSNSGANWLTHELRGRMSIVLSYPFLREASPWRADSLRLLERELTKQVHPDGFQIELTTGYQMDVIGSYVGVLDSYRRAGETPPAFLASRLRDMYGIYPKLSRPDRRSPNLNDGSCADVKDICAKALRIFPDDPEFRWFATDGREGAEPTCLSLAMPYAGSIIMRTSWKPDAVWGYFDASEGWRGFHSHEDALGFLLFAYGKEMLTEGGCFLYDSSEMRKYVISTRAHNTVMVDGLEQHRKDNWCMDPNRKPCFDFRTTPDVDYARAVYLDCYGENNLNVKHMRTVIFRKRDAGLCPYFIVVDRLKAPDDAEHGFDVLWHLRESELSIGERSFAAEFGGGVKLLAFASDPAPYVDMKGMKEPVFQGWRPVWKAGPTEHIPIPTPVQRGTFAGSRRIVTVLYPSRDGSSPVVAVKASEDVHDRTIRMILSDGTERTLEERNGGSD